MLGGEGGVFCDPNPDLELYLRRFRGLMRSLLLLDDDTSRSFVEASFAA